MDGTIIDLDYVIGISDINTMKELYDPNKSVTFYTNIIFYIILREQQYNVSFSNTSPKIVIYLEQDIHYFKGNNKNYDKEFIERYKQYPNENYKKYLNLIEIFKKHKNCTEIIEV
jgi:hypothetical protein